ncbi:MAG: molybdopterin molybdotransferase MoeA [Gammaproteobacteria bacterium]|nr:molybdopterin molybdotransferase MoeA [Gammaproteobacteria bacterium]
MTDTRPDPCATPRDALLSVEDARKKIAALLQVIEGAEQLPLRDTLDRVLAQEVISGIDVPPHDNSAMDGYALRGADLPAQGEAELQLIGKAFAGTGFVGEVATGQCVRIMTGAMIPKGADTVIMQEQVRVEGERIRIGTGHQPGSNVRRAGEDMASGEVVLRPGHRITAADLGVLASLGLGEVRVRRRLRVAFFSTGDELRSVGEPLLEGQIYDSNRYTLHGMLTRLGVELLDLGVIRDDRAAIQQAFRDASAMADVVITSGGVSVGEADFVKQTLDELGQVDFWRIAMKPGKPLAFGRLGRAVFFGLPGNPVSVMATFYQFVQPALRAMMGQVQAPAMTLQLPTETPLKKAPGRTDFQRGRLVRGEDGQLRVNSTGLQGSHVLTSMSQADCFIILPADCAGVAAGELVEVQPFSGLI